MPAPRFCPKVGRVEPEKIRVAVVSDYPLDGPGGAETACAEQIRILTDTGHRVTVITPAGTTGGVLGPDVDVVPIGWERRLPGLGLPIIRNDAILRDRLRALLVARRIDAVHLHSEFGLAAVVVEAANALGLPTALTVHTFFWRAAGLGQTSAPVQRLMARAVPRWHRWVTGWAPTGEQLADRPGDSALRNMTLTVARRCGRVISPSAHQARRLRAAGAGEVVVLPNAWSKPVPGDPLHRVDGALRVIWIGRCSAEKRLLPFVQAAVAAVDQVGPAALAVTVVGEGDQFAAARRLASGRGSIRFLGRRAHDDVPALLAEHHLLALTSYGWDNQPMTVVEAVSALRGVLHCDPALTEGLDGAGLLVGPEPAAIAAALLELAGDSGPVLAASAAALQAREVFSPRRFVAGLHAALDLPLQTSTEPVWVRC